MEGTVQGALRAGYTSKQACLIGQLDDLFEEAIELGLITGDQAEEIGIVFGQLAAMNTGKV